jgi:protein involved in polysaccharide export with SLBB domain
MHRLLDHPRLLAAALAATSLLAGCGDYSQVPVATPPVLATPLQPVAYRIAPGDEIEIRQFFNPELNDRLLVRPDGRVALQLIGDYEASGKTSEQMRQELTDLYRKQVKTPEITVVVRTFGSREVFVGGEVERGGVVTFNRPVTAMRAIMEAGGLRNTARTDEIIIARRNVDGTPRIFKVNLQAFVENTDPTQDPVLEPYDLVFVPRSRIADVNLFIAQYLRENIPYSFNYDLSRLTSD